jgi:hypothetical protein
MAEQDRQLETPGPGVCATAARQERANRSSIRPIQIAPQDGDAVYGGTRDTLEALAA